MKKEMLATPNDVLLTQEEIAARLKVTARTVVRLQNDGVVPFILLGKCVRFYWPAVVSHLNTNCTVCRSLRSATMLPAIRPPVPTANKGGRP
jgi:excisionase family DNA binding protein